MVKKIDRKDLNGIVVVNKPIGPTSHDIVDRVRRIFKMRRIGHAGTLDPMATGVLVMLVGKGTKLFERFMQFDKAYRATLILGKKTTSADTQGELVEEKSFDGVTREGILEVFASFLGESHQMPPMVSAVKVNGNRLYDLARQGIEVERKARAIRIDKVELLKFEPPYVEFILECSKGTYVRTFAEDVGARLGCGACVCQIERLKVGPYLINDAIELERLKEDDVRDFKE